MWCGTTKGRGLTTHGTRRCSDPGRPTHGTRCTSRRCLPRWNSRRSPRLAWASGRHGWSLKCSGGCRSCCSPLVSRGSAGRPAGVIAAALLATNYVYVMWNRAALMEAPMTALIVASWYCYTRAEESRAVGLGRGGVRAAGVLHQGLGGILRRGDRPGHAAAALARKGTSRHAPSWRPGSCSPPWRWRCSSCPTGRSTGSTTGRCPSPASRVTRWLRSWIARRGSRCSTICSRACGSRSSSA